MCMQFSGNEVKRTNKKSVLVSPLASGLLLVLLGLIAYPSQAAEPNQVLNLYSARHYQTDEALYANFTKSTGIKINRIEADDNALLERLNSEGARSPADVILLVEIGRAHV